jgi:hypothetical protein
MNDDESMLPSIGSEAEQAPLRLLDILHNRIIQKKAKAVQNSLKVRYRSCLDRDRNITMGIIRVLSEDD